MLGDHVPMPAAGDADAYHGRFVRQGDDAGMNVLQRMHREQCIEFSITRFAAAVEARREAETSQLRDFYPQIAQISQNESRGIDTSLFQSVSSAKSADELSECLGEALHARKPAASAIRQVIRRPRKTA
jgi:hypothetical protein